MWWDADHWYWGLAMMILFWGAIVAILVVFRNQGERPRPSARELLDERFARGELSEDEHRAKRTALEGRASDH